MTVRGTAEPPSKRLRSEPSEEEPSNEVSPSGSGLNLQSSESPDEEPLDEASPGGSDMNQQSSEQQNEEDSNELPNDSPVENNHSQETELSHGSSSHPSEVFSPPLEEAIDPSLAIASTSSANVQTHIPASAESEHTVEWPAKDIYCRTTVCLNCFKPSKKTYCSTCSKWVHYFCITSEVASKFSTPAHGGYCFYCQQLDSIRISQRELGVANEPEILGALLNIDVRNTRCYDEPPDINGGQLLWRTVAGVGLLIGDFVQYNTDYEKDGICQILSIVMRESDSHVFILGKYYYTDFVGRSKTEVLRSDDSFNSIIILERAHIYRKVHVSTQTEFECGRKVVNISQKYHYWCKDKYNDSRKTFLAVEDCSFYPRNGLFIESMNLELME